MEVTILSGDRDTFQLATDKVTIRIPRTKAGKTETEEYNREKIKQTYGIEPKQLIEVKGLQGDTSDNIPGVPGIGEKTALSLIQKYGTIENLYKSIEEGEDDLKGKQKEKIVENKDLAEMSRFLGTINLEVPIEDTLENFKVEEWDSQKVYEIFKELNFSRYIERFGLNHESQAKEKEIQIKIEEITIEKVIQLLNGNDELIFTLGTKKDENNEKIIKEKITSIGIYSNEISYFVKLENEDEILKLKEIFENKNIKKIGINLTKQYILLKQVGINIQNINYDIQVASYILNPTDNENEYKQYNKLSNHEQESPFNDS